MRNRKETAWKKNRKFGDVYGGRMAPKIADKIFNRAHRIEHDHILRAAQRPTLPLVLSRWMPRRSAPDWYSVARVWFERHGG